MRAWVVIVIAGAVLLGALAPALAADGAARPAEVRALLDAHYRRRLAPGDYDGLDRGIAAALTAIDPLIAISDGTVQPEEDRADRRAVALGVTLVEDRRGVLLVPRRPVIGRLPEAARLLAIGRTPVRSMDDAVQRLGAARLPGPVEFTLRPDAAGAPFRVVLPPVANRPGPALETWSVGGTTVIRIHAFVVGETEWQVAEAIRRAPANRVVLDLRYCSGGNPFSAFAVAGLFFPTGDTMGYLQGRDGVITALVGPGAEPSAERAPLVVLAGAATASAAEITALLLASGGRAAVVGEATFGKCVIVRRFELATGGSLSLPVAEVIGRSGERCHRIGVTPTHPVAPERRHADALIADLPGILADTPDAPPPSPLPASPQAEADTALGEAASQAAPAQAAPAQAAPVQAAAPETSAAEAPLPPAPPPRPGVKPPVAAPSPPGADAPVATAPPPAPPAPKPEGGGVTVSFGAFIEGANARARQEQVRAALLAAGERREVRVVPAQRGAAGRPPLRLVVVEGLPGVAEAAALCTRLSGVWPRRAPFECRRLGRR